MIQPVGQFPRGASRVRNVPNMKNSRLLTASAHHQSMPVAEPGELFDKSPSLARQGSLCPIPNANLDDSRVASPGSGYGSIDGRAGDNPAVGRPSRIIQNFRQLTGSDSLLAA